MSLKRDLTKHVKALAIKDPKLTHVFIFNSEMVTLKDAQYALKALESMNVNAAVMIVKGDVRQAAEVVAISEDGEIVKVTDEEVVDVTSAK